MKQSKRTLSRGRSAFVLSVLTVALAACGGNAQGNLSATSLGDVSHPARRGSPVAELDAACGTGAATLAGSSVLPRWPYLQQVTMTSAIVGWVTSSPSSGQQVIVTTPAGDAVATVPAEPQTTIARTSGTRQMWSHVTGLAPDTVYCYAIADENGTLVDRAGLRTAPAVGSETPTRFLAFGDSGSGDGDQLALLDQMYTVPFDLAIHTGDLAYDSGTIGEIEDHVFGVYAGWFRSRPFYPSPGNHDYKTQDAAPFRGVFALPNNERWYSFDWGNVHFVALDTEQPLGTQATWLDEDLAATALPWKIVYLHEPPYSSGDHGSSTDVRAAFAPIFEKHGVQLVLAGHDHHYERIAPQKGVHYIVTGGGGKGTRAVARSSFTTYAQEVIHLVYGEATRDELVLHAIDGNGTEFDSLVIRR
jgi:hypothetical protein